jgi:hypothetical protein
MTTTTTKKKTTTVLLSPSILVDNKEISCYDVSLPVFDTIVGLIKSMEWLPNVLGIDGKTQVELRSDLILEITCDEAIQKHDWRETVKQKIVDFNDKRDPRCVIEKDQVKLNFAWKFQSDSLRVVFYVC